MSLGAYIFASVVLTLAVFHKGFRKMALSAGVAVIAVVGVWFGGAYAYGKFQDHEEKLAAQHLVELRKDCVARYKNATIGWWNSDLQAAAQENCLYSPHSIATNLNVLEPGETLGPIVQFPQQGTVILPPSETVGPTVQAPQPGTVILQFGTRIYKLCHFEKLDISARAVCDTSDGIAQLHYGDQVKFLSAQV